MVGRSSIVNRAPLANPVIRPYVFSTECGVRCLALAAADDMDGLATPVCYWHITVEISEDLNVAEHRLRRCPAGHDR